MAESPDRSEPAGGDRSPGATPRPRGFPGNEQSLEVRLRHVAHRLAAEYPEQDPATIQQLVHATATRLLARSKLAEFIPLFTERNVRAWLDERTPNDQHIAKTG
jgi:hypothetical protein